MEILRSSTFITVKNRKDRLGSFLLAPLIVRAFAFHFDLRYCWIEELSEVDAVLEPREVYSQMGWSHLEAHLENFSKVEYITDLINITPAPSVLHVVTNDGRKLESMINQIGISLDHLFSSSFTEILRYEFQAAQKLNSLSSDSTIAVHVRRGDVSRDSHAWIPEARFVDVIRDVKTASASTTAKVHVFSNSCNQLELGLISELSDEVFLREDDPNSSSIENEILDWIVFLSAESLVVGGTFSYVPALLSVGNIFYPEGFWHKKLEHWHSFTAF